MDVKRFAVDHWPLIGALAAGLVAWGVTTADISQLKTDRDQSKLDHDIVVEVRTKQDRMQKDIDEIKQLVKELAERERRQGG